MRLKTIKSKTGNEFFTKSIERTIELIKSADNSVSNEPFFFLGWFSNKDFFLQENNVYVLSTEYDYDENRNPVLESLKLNELYKIGVGVGVNEVNEVNRVNENDIEVSTVLQNNNLHKLPYTFTLEFTPTPDTFITY